MIDITNKIIDTDKIIQSVITPESGAVNVFIGTTRNHSNGKSVVKLEYEAYNPMALKKMEQIRKEAHERWDVHNVALVHRIGEVAVGEASVVIAVSSSHRHEAFEACRYIIDRLKAVVPIWKREYFADGSVEWSKATHTEKIKE
jgi:molybdopterin synthase catalytic subunit